MALPNVPNTTTFTLEDVIASVLPYAVAQVDTVTLNGTPSNCNVWCNGYSHTMIWDTNTSITITQFIATYGSSYGAVTLYKTSTKTFKFTANVPGTPFSAAGITTGYGSAVNTVPNTPSTKNLQDCFDEATESKFDSRYYPYYLVTGSNYLVHNSQLNFRNYGGTPDGIPIPVATGAKLVHRTSFFASWNESVGATGYYLDVSIYSDFHDTGSGYQNMWYDDGFGGGTVSGLNSDTVHYYRLRAITPNGVSGYSNVSKLRTCSLWYLPSLQELDDIYDNVWDDGGNGSFQQDYYWSSTEYISTQAYELTFVDGSYMTTNKGTGDPVRAVRHFSTAYNYALGEETDTGRYISYKADNGDGTWLYYECNQSDLADQQAWSNVTNTLVGGTSANRGTGYANTALIMAQPGHTDSAAKLCHDLATD